MKSVVVIFILGSVLAPKASNAQESTTTTAGLDTTTTTTSSSSSTTPTTTPSSSTTLTPEQECKQHDGSCDKCVHNPKCLYCYSDDKCTLYPVGKILPPSDVCALDKARWGVCWVNFEALIISVSVIGGVILITAICCCYCCCCRSKNTARFDKEDAKFESQKMDRKVKQDERRTERKTRLDEIRRKYGLMKDETPYQKFDS